MLSDISALERSHLKGSLANYKQSPLYKACLHGTIVAVRWLLEAKADVHACHALSAATCAPKHVPELVELLLEHKASPRATESSGLVKPLRTTLHRNTLVDDVVRQMVEILLEDARQHEHKDSSTRR